MADIKISELEPTTDLEGLFTIGSDKNNLSKKVSLQFLKDAANYANEQGDYAKQAGDTVNGNVGVSDYPEFSASKSYVIGDIVRYNGVLYAFTANHAASAWNGNDVKATSINAITSGKLTELESKEITNALGILITNAETLTIDAKNTGYFAQGNLYQGSGEYHYTDLIKAIPGKYVMVSMGSPTVDKIGLYDANKNYLRRIAYNDDIGVETEVEIPSDAVYVRFTTLGEKVSLKTTEKTRLSTEKVIERNVFRYDDVVVGKAINTKGEFFNASSSYNIVKMYLNEGKYVITLPESGSQTTLWKYADDTYSTNGAKMIIGNTPSPISKVYELEAGYYAFSWNDSSHTLGLASITNAYIQAEYFEKNLFGLPFAAIGNVFSPKDVQDASAIKPNTGEIWKVNFDYKVAKFQITDKGYYWVVTPGNGSQATLCKYADDTYSTDGAKIIIGTAYKPFQQIVFLETGYYAFSWNERIDGVNYNGGGFLTKHTALQNFLGTSIEIVLPKTIYAVVGDTLQLFYNGIIKAVKPESYDIVVTCNRGKQYPRYYEYTPTSSDIGTTSFTISVYDNNGNLINSETCQLVTRARASSPTTQKNIVCFGDSLTRYGTWCKELQRRLSGNGGQPQGDFLSRVNLVGRMKEDNTGWFGVGGWSWNSYVTNQIGYKFFVSGVTTVRVGDYYNNNGHTYRIVEVNITEGAGYISGFAADGGAPQASGILEFSEGSSDGDRQISFSASELDPSNPFWDSINNKVSFIPYANAYADGKIDVIVSLMSWNGLQIGASNHQYLIDKIKILVDAFHAEFPQGKWKLCGMQLPSINGGVGANYGAIGRNSYADTYGMVRTIMDINKAYKEFAELPEYSDFVEFVCISAEFDSLYNMPSMEKNVNTRNTSIKERIGTNGVHPSTSGYYQIADTIYRNLTNYLSM